MRAWRWAGVTAGFAFVGAVLGFGAALDGYSQSSYPVALLGAAEVPHALAFNALGFVLPGVLVAWVAGRLRGALAARAGWAARIGARLLMLSAVAFAAQGVLPLQADLDAPLSRLHATAWTAWWVACAPAGLLLAFGLRARDGAGWLRIASAGMAIAVPACAVLAVDTIGAPFAQRLAFAVWFAWLAIGPFGIAVESDARALRGFASGD